MEKYGTVPPKFTKAWWDHIWYYYKWHFLGTLFVLFLIATSCVQCARTVKYDLTMMYVGAPYYPEEIMQGFEQGITEQIEDVTGNGKKDVSIQMLTQGSGLQAADPQYAYALQMKATVEYQSGESVIFLYSGEQMNSIQGTSSIEGLFVPVAQWNPGYAGTGEFLNLAGNTFFESLGIDTGDLYMAVRNIRDDEKEEEISTKRYENAMKLAQVIAKNQ